MIEVITDRDRNLKNLKQIGTPKEENKIYIENSAYVKIKEQSYKEKRVFVLMGHTERSEGRYMTFVESVIPVKEVEFSGNTPRWNNGTWSEVFREIKRLYEDMIIVGWAIDIKGMMPKVTPELERVHREHFGGVHQLLFLLDTIEEMETFYVYKENKVVSKDGFYIYQQARKREQEPIPITVLSEEKSPVRKKEREVDVELNIVDIEQRKGGRYRQLMQEQKTTRVSEGGNAGLAVAIAMLIFVIGVGVYENRDDIFGEKGAIETNIMQEDGDDITVEIITDTEAATESAQVVEPDTESSSDVIEIEILPDEE